jgi:hypothetical protein
MKTYSWAVWATLGAVASGCGAAKQDDVTGEPLGSGGGSMVGGSAAGGSPAGGSPAGGSESTNPPAAGGTPVAAGGGLVVPDDEEGSTGGAGQDDVCTLAILGDPGSNPSANFAEWIAERGPVVERFDAETRLPLLTAAELGRFDVVFLDWLAPETMSGVTPSEFGAWVESGGRLVALSGYADYPEALDVQNEMLEPLGLGFDATMPYFGPVVDFVPHPITAGLTSLTFVGGRVVTHEADDEVLMTMGEPALPTCVVGQRGSGKVFLFGDEWVTYDSEWSAQPEIEEFWVNVFAWLGDCDLQVVVK